MKGYWKGRPAQCAKVRAVLGNSGRFPELWHSAMVGEERDAVEVRVYGERVVNGIVRSYKHEPFYLDDHDGEGWRKVTEGRGADHYPHRELDVEKVVTRACCCDNCECRPKGVG